MYIIFILSINSNTGTFICKHLHVIIYDNNKITIVSLNAVQVHGAGIITIIIHTNFTCTNFFLCLISDADIALHLYYCSK